MDQLFHTDTVPASGHESAWRSAIDDILGMDIDFADAPRDLTGGIWRSTAGPVEVYATRLPFAHSVRNNRARGRVLKVLRQDGGQCRIGQGGNSANYRAGDIAILDGSLSFSGDMSGVGGGTWLSIPVASAPGALGRVLAATGHRIDGSTGAGAVASAFLREFSRQADSLAADQALRMFGVLVDLLTTASLQDVCRPRSRSAEFLLRQILLYVEGNLSDSGLTPASIAEHHRISRRYLDRLFEYQPHTLMKLIRERRLLRCRNDLANGDLEDSTITEIAFGWGFSSASHFSRSYKQRFGIGPREHRRAVIRQRRARKPSSGT